MTERTRSSRRALVTGECDHCQWKAVADSYPEMVEMRHDHLREHHPTAWMRS